MPRCGGLSDVVPCPVATVLEKQEDQVLSILKTTMPVQASVGKGPMKAVREAQLASMCESKRKAWLLEARLDAIVGSCRLSLPSVRSGIKCYLAFVQAAFPAVETLFPPPIDWLLAWSACFRCKETFANYVGYVRTACLLLLADVSVFEHAALTRAKVSIV